MSKTIEELQKTIHADNVDRGWWDEFKLSTGEVRLSVHDDMERRAAIEKLCLIHSEISEALEEIRNGWQFNEVRVDPTGKPLGFPTEIADAVIRLLDLADACGIDLGAVIDQKLAYNRTRGYRHGGKLA